jgi:hypothetical protein
MARSKNVLFIRVVLVIIWCYLIANLGQSLEKQNLIMGITPLQSCSGLFHWTFVFKVYTHFSNLKLLSSFWDYIKKYIPTTNNVVML